jgi:hypothetical protein
MHRWWNFVFPAVRNKFSSDTKPVVTSIIHLNWEGKMFRNLFIYFFIVWFDFFFTLNCYAVNSKEKEERKMEISSISFNELLDNRSHLIPGPLSRRYFHTLFFFSQIVIIINIIIRCRSFDLPLESPFFSSSLWLKKGKTRKCGSGDPCRKNKKFRGVEMKFQKKKKVGKKFFFFRWKVEIG